MEGSLVINVSTDIETTLYVHAVGLSTGLGQGLGQGSGAGLGIRGLVWD